MSIESDKIIPPSVIIKQPSFLTKHKNYILIFISLLIVGMTVYFIYKKSTKKEKVDCQLSDWVYNNNCICDNGSPSGYKYKYQSIIKNADNGGISCPSADSLRQKILSCNCSTPSPSSSSTPTPSPSSSSAPRPSPSSSSTPRPSPSSSSTPRPSPSSSLTNTLVGKTFKKGNTILAYKIRFIDNSSCSYRSHFGTYTFDNSTNMGSVTIPELFGNPSVYFEFSYDSSSNTIWTSQGIFTMI